MVSDVRRDGPAVRAKPDMVELLARVASHEGASPVRESRSPM
jgi:hypothetical protein